MRNGDDAADVGVDADVVLRHGQLEVAPLGRVQPEPLFHQDGFMLLCAGAGPELLKLPESQSYTESES